MAKPKLDLEITETPKTPIIPFYLSEANIGDIVWFHREKMGSNGQKFLQRYPALIGSLAEGFKTTDMAVNITIFITFGGVIEARHAVLYSETPANGRWTPKS